MKRRKPKAGKRAQDSSFEETARELGLDNEESAEAFERAFSKIAPPKKRSDAACKEAKEPPFKKN